MKRKIPLLALTSAMLASCSISINPKQSSSSPASVSEPAPTSSVAPSIDSQENKPLPEVSSEEPAPEISEAASSEEDSGKGYAKFSTEDIRLANYPSHNVFQDDSVLDSIGDQKLLVIPVYTTDGGNFTQAELNMIETAYNGESDETGWRSLRTFYEESSYGKLSMRATLVSPYALGKTTSAFAKQYTNWDEFEFGSYLNTIVQSYASAVDLKQFDQNNDGYIDGVEFVYKNNGTEWDGYSKTTEVWWAFTNLTYKSANKTNPVAGAFFWSPYDMIETNYYTPNIDVHTLVHETGHLLGADDYYSYEAETDGFPAGMVDMMDCNVGDHNAFTKSIYGWVDPYAPDGSKDQFEITLNSFQSSGDCLILVDPSKWNGTVYDEYFMLSYYTPDGLYEEDVSGYPEYSGSDMNNGKIYQKAGLQMFHVDARVGTYNQRSGKVTFATDPLDEDACMLASNTSSYSKSGYTLIEAISADGVNHFKGSRASSRYFGSQKVLFGTSAYGCGSSEFTANTAKNILKNSTKMNNGNAIPWSFSVTEQTDSTITLSVTKN